MKKLHFVFVSCSVFFLLNLCLKSLEVDRPDFLKFYLNDLLAMPIVLGISLFMTRILHRDQNLRLGLFTAFSVAILYALYFELYLPGRNVRYTADPIDVLLYFSGALIFYLAQPKQTTSAVVEKPSRSRDFSEVEK